MKKLILLLFVIFVGNIGFANQNKENKYSKEKINFELNLICNNNFLEQFNFSQVKKYETYLLSFDSFCSVSISSSYKGFTIFRNRVPCSGIRQAVDEMHAILRKLAGDE
ncbi:hypothetical protein IU405_03550 [Polaribacter sp. BAL334]|uniref:hypothetical protein n=1 Tax=Polaribacter sp. BAL334 TaxID=1708178 RepID=UPI0018D209E2|nr:hypothetical protein [Polaribacter sp. BAL334]MBG7611316.1 hypothetical protein [Polaribacter sp. BAL334]